MEVKKRYLILGLGLIVTIFSMWFFKTPIDNGAEGIQEEIKEIQQDTEELGEMADSVIVNVAKQTHKVDSLNKLLDNFDSLNKEEIIKLEDQIEDEKKLIKYYKEQSKKVIEPIIIVETLPTDTLVYNYTYKDSLIVNYHYRDTIIYNYIYEDSIIKKNKKKKKNKN